MFEGLGSFEKNTAFLQHFVPKQSMIPECSGIWPWTAFTITMNYVNLEYSNCYFSRMRSKGSRFTLGSGGLGVCSLDVAEPSATVRVMAVWRAYGKFCRGVVVGGFTCRVASFCVAGVALRDIHTCFV